MTACGPNTPPGGWRHAMAAYGAAVHLCDPADTGPEAAGERGALCGVSPVYFAPHPLAADPLAVAGLCRNCRPRAAAWRPPAGPGGTGG